MTIYLCFACVWRGHRWTLQTLRRRCSATSFVTSWPLGDRCGIHIKPLGGSPQESCLWVSHSPRTPLWKVTKDSACSKHVALYPLSGVLLDLTWWYSLDHQTRNARGTSTKATQHLLDRSCARNVYIIIIIWLYLQWLTYRMRRLMDRYPEQFKRLGRKSGIARLPRGMKLGNKPKFKYF